MKRKIKLIQIFIVTVTTEHGSCVLKAFDNMRSADAYIRREKKENFGNYDVLSRIVEVAA